MTAELADDRALLARHKSWWLARGAAWAQQQRWPLGCCKGLAVLAPAFETGQRAVHLNRLVNLPKKVGAGFLGSLTTSFPLGVLRTAVWVTGGNLLEHGRRLKARTNYRRAP